MFCFEVTVFTKKRKLKFMCTKIKLYKFSWVLFRYWDLPDTSVINIEVNFGIERENCGIHGPFRLSDY